MNKNIITILAVLIIFMIAVPVSARPGRRDRAQKGKDFVLVNEHHGRHALGGRSRRAHRGLEVAEQHSAVIRERDDTDDNIDDGKDGGGDDLGDKSVVVVNTKG